MKLKTATMRKLTTAGLLILLLSILPVPALAVDAPNNYSQYQDVYNNDATIWGWIIAYVEFWEDKLGPGVLWTGILGAVAIGMYSICNSLTVLVSTYLTIGTVLSFILPPELKNLAKTMVLLGLVFTLALAAKRQ